MASAASEPPRVLGRLDSAGRLIAADPELGALQGAAGASVGQALALPQIAAIADLARKLGTSVTRAAVAANEAQDIDLWVTATPEGEEIALSLEGWTARPAASPRLAALLGGGIDGAAEPAPMTWATDEELRLISLSDEFASFLDADAEEVAGSALTKVLKLEEDEDGQMPLLGALAGRRAFGDQHAQSRRDPDRAVVLTGEVVNAADGSFAGFRGTATQTGNGTAGRHAVAAVSFDQVLDDVLRSPLDRIIATAERILERADGPLRSDYASYGNDIAAAARHLLSVIRSMSEDPAQGHRTLDLAALAAEAVVMLESTAEERNIRLELEGEQTLRASGQERGVIQILVNLIGNALRHSPDGSRVVLRFARTDGTASVAVCDEGPGIPPADQQRIFERFERAETTAEGTGLGLAISRRLARSMGGDVSVESEPGQGARFTLTLPT